MPYKEISFDQIVFDPEVQTYCNNPKFRCTNYAHFWTCPPEAPYLENEVSQFKKFYLIYYQFDVEAYVNKIKQKHPKRSEDRIKFSIYRKNYVRNYLEKEVYDFLDNFQDNYDEKLILWDGHCRICNREKKNCTYDSGEPCRYPNKQTYSMEAVGINVDKTVRNLNIKIEWPPKRYVYRFGLVCFK